MTLQVATRPFAMSYSFSVPTTRLVLTVDSDVMVAQTVATLPMSETVALVNSLISHCCVALSL